MRVKPSAIDIFALDRFDSYVVIRNGAFDHLLQELPIRKGSINGRFDNSPSSIEYAPSAMVLPWDIKNI
ncbi:hypothetical protein AX289_11220 [Methylorubrum populi]|nr:hypothetical protein AX289_11220 [Methylorubrum populi]